MKVLFDVFKEESSTIFAAIFILLVILVLAACGIYLVEHHAQPDVFGSIPQAMWWSTVTLTTVGYGDVTPITTLGKIFGGLVTVLGVGMAALPAGILASGLADQLRRRRDSLRRQFQTMLEDGIICELEETEFEKLRVSLGLSRNVAEQIREEVRFTQEIMEKRSCPHCGKSIYEDS
jgi:voltage-gated potassium channel